MIAAVGGFAAGHSHHFGDHPMPRSVGLELHQAVGVETQLVEFMAPVTVFAGKDEGDGLAYRLQAAAMGIVAQDVVIASVSIEFGGGHLDFGILGGIGNHGLVGAAQSLNGKCPTFFAPCDRRSRCAPGLRPKSPIDTFSDFARGASGRFLKNPLRPFHAAGCAGRGEGRPFGRGRIPQDSGGKEADRSDAVQRYWSDGWVVCR